MIVFSDTSSIDRIDNLDVRRLVDRRINEIGIGGCFIVVEPDDSVEALEKTSGCPVDAG